MKTLNKFAKILIISLSGIAVFYSASWFASKYYVNSKINDYFTLMSSSNDIKNITFSSEIGCFPKMCVTIKDINVETAKGYLDNPEGLNITIFDKYPLIYQTNNIFYPRVKFKQDNSKFDFTVSGAESSAKVSLEAYLNNLNIDFSKEHSLFSADKIAIMASVANSALTSIIDTNNLSLEYKEEKNTKSSLEVNITDFKKYNGYGVVAKTLNHLYANLEVLNFNKDFVFRSIHALQNAKTFEEKAKFLEAAIKNIVENKSELKIKDFKMTDNEMQVMSKGVATINKNNFIIGKLAIAVKFLSEESMFEQMLIASNVQKNKLNSYDIDLVLTDKGGFFNSNLFMPPLNLNRVDTTTKENKKQDVTQKL